jgi:hypothetical protein
MDTLVPPAGEEWISKRSMSRRAPTMPSPMPVLEEYSPFRMAVQIADAGAPVRDADDEDLRRRLALHGELHAAAAGILKCVARDLRYGRGEPGLLLTVEAQQRRNLARALAGGHYVLFVSDFSVQNGSIRIPVAPPALPRRSRHRGRGHSPGTTRRQSGWDAARAAGVGIERPMRLQAVGVHHQERAGFPGISELRDFPCLVPGGTGKRYEAPHGPDSGTMAALMLPTPAKRSTCAARSISATATAAPRVGAQGAMNPLQQGGAGSLSMFARRTNRGSAPHGRPAGHGPDRRRQ